MISDDDETTRLRYWWQTVIYPVPGGLHCGRKRLNSQNARKGGKKPRSFDGVSSRISRKYFKENLVYGEKDFERGFCMPGMCLIEYVTFF